MEKEKEETLLLTMDSPKTPCGLTLSSLPIVLTLGRKGQHILHIKVTI